jgi:hypothetical protein
MVKITRRDLLLTSARYSREFGVVRSTGCHLSQVIERITARETKKTFDDWDEQELEGVRTPGFVWERVMSEHAYDVSQQKLVEPGEMFWCYQCDETMAGTTVARNHCNTCQHKGIYFTPDFVVVEERGTSTWFPLETKFTWMSSKRAGPDSLDIAKWRYQLTWQAMGLESDRGQIQAMFCRGDYTPGRPRVDAFVFDFVFDERDLKKNKIMIVSNAKAEGLL